MSETGITARRFREMLAFVAERIFKEEARLNRLDAALGDGDHGITMRLGFEAIKGKLATLDAEADFNTTLTEAGMAFMGGTGGAIGIVLGKMLVAAGCSLKGTSKFGVAEFGSFLASMEASVSNSGKVKPGDKTILDAVSSARQSLTGSESSLREALTEAAVAAEAAAQNTAHMICRVGRASRLGERTLGHPDPGAVSFSIILRAMRDWLAARSAATA
jgi:dihydroxyacetone kinase-like protein